MFKLFIEANTKLYRLYATEIPAPNAMSASIFGLRPRIDLTPLTKYFLLSIRMGTRNNI